ncbi:BTB/POZ domain-containing protein POB1-like isoform X2 [Solanum pennellii]|uniref:BTB/POZ domain-containing protein POB1-like isoform X2 n=1 Tax=Solanum pennellii TaxID=28526 RepID=A0ABM1V1C5_SOLPN|nr:BTB/POZ domain-containing protein POB1-like isoform X2 [Solanum pennellii]
MKNDFSDPLTKMDPLGYGSGTGSNFSFAYDNAAFSDRILTIQIVPNSKSDGEGCSSTAGDLDRKRKRRREETSKQNDVLTQREDEVLNCTMLDTEFLAYENQDEEAVAIAEESSSGVEMTTDHPGGGVASKSTDSFTYLNSAAALSVKTIRINSAILAAQSPFFYKLFSNGMRESESEKQLVTVQIYASEEAAFIKLLQFMYSNTLSTITATAMLDVLMAADKFEVASCMRHCSRLLLNLPMTCESASLFLNLPSSVSITDAVQPLLDAAKQFLAAHFKDITKFQVEVLNLPIAGFEAVLCNDDLQVASEDVVYDFVLKWARTHYPNLEERREILGSRLCHLIRFPYMTCSKLRKVLTCNDFDPELASKNVLGALFFKAEAPHRQRLLVAEEGNASCSSFVERAYKFRPIKVVNFELPFQHCIVYLDLKRQECNNLFPAGRIYSQAFHLGGQVFHLSAHCNMDQQNSFHWFGMFLSMQEKGLETFTVDFDFAALTTLSEDYLSRYKGSHTFTRGKGDGFRNLVGIPWTTFIAEGSVYFINGILRVRAVLTVRQ